MYSIVLYVEYIPFHFDSHVMARVLVHPCFHEIYIVPESFRTR